MPIFILVGKVVLLVCVKSALIMSFPERTINETPLKSHENIIGTGRKHYTGLRFAETSESWEVC